MKTHITRIFIVEDDMFCNKMLTMYLSSKNIGEIQSFYSGEECLTQLFKRPEIVLLDFDLPGRDGVSTLKEIKLRSPESIVIFLSGQTDVKVAIEAIRSGAYDYIVKDEHANETALNKIDQIRRLQKAESKNTIRKRSNLILLLIVVLSWTAFVIYALMEK